MCSWLALALAWIPVGATGATGAGGAGDPVAGVWKGTLIGDDALFPKSGVPASFWLARGPDGVTGSLEFQGFTIDPITGTFDPATGVLSIAGEGRGAPVTARVDVASDELAGELTGLGRTFPVSARRIATVVLPAPAAPAAPVDVARLDADDWRADLAFLADYLPQVHANAFHTITPEGWRAAVGALDARLDELDGPRAAVALAQLVARVGDAHTELAWRELAGFDAAPIRFERFADGVFVTGVDARWSHLLGARVIEIGRRSPARALDAAATVFAAENDSWRARKGLGNLAIPRLLEVLDVSSLGEALPLVVETPDGQEIEDLVEGPASAGWRSLPDPTAPDAPRWSLRRGERYWFEPLEGPAGPALYWAYNKCAEDPRRPMVDFLDELLATFDERGATRLVIDLRNNSGGDSSVLSTHLPRLFEHCGADALRVLIGPTTYSSGMMNAHQLRTAGATLFGEPTGGKPNSWGELRSFRLPRSGLAVFYSVKYFRMLDEDPPAVEPDVLVRPRAADVFAGRDPVLATALAHGG